MLSAKLCAICYMLILKEEEKITIKSGLAEPVYPLNNPSLHSFYFEVFGKIHLQLNYSPQTNLQHQQILAQKREN